MGFARFVAFVLKNVGHQLVAIAPARASGYISAHRSGQSVHRYLWNPFIVIQINTSINLGHGFKKANAVILRCR